MASGSTDTSSNSIGMLRRYEVMEKEPSDITSTMASLTASRTRSHVLVSPLHFTPSATSPNPSMDATGSASPNLADRLSRLPLPPPSLSRRHPRNPSSPKPLPLLHPPPLPAVRHLRTESPVANLPPNPTSRRKSAKMANSQKRNANT